MYELSVARKYLIPRWRQLSVSIISLISILVIALVVWLIVVFFSVKDGLENGWIEKLVALTAPVRITPTDKYYESYYYLADSISSGSNYSSKSIREKSQTENVDPYDPNIDEEIPAHWPKPDLNDQGNLKNPVQQAYAIAGSLKGLKNIKVSDFEMTMAQLHLRLLRKNTNSEAKSTQQFIETSAYLGSFNPDTSALTKALLPATSADLANLRLIKGTSPLAIPNPSKNGIIMPNDSRNGEAILLPRAFRDGGALIGDQGYISYYSPTPSAIQEQQVPVYVAGFYDPGIISVGGKYILANKELVSQIKSSHNPEDTLASNGINIHFDNLGEASRVKRELIKAFDEQGLTPYWRIQTYEEYDFAKDFIQQLQSEKNLFSLISLIVIIVACSNIISMLIILVNDKKLEIGILRSMGASSLSIAAIFGICGMIMGAVGSLVGTAAALLTLKYVNELVALISAAQGHELFNPMFYGSVLPSELSIEALMLVTITTATISLIAGIVPALKASMLRPSAILRAE